MTSQEKKVLDAALAYFSTKSVAGFSTLEAEVSLLQRERNALHSVCTAALLDELERRLLATLFWSLLPVRPLGTTVLSRDG